jgi:predicted DNA-binding transcriptional regulator YafY
VTVPRPYRVEVVVEAPATDVRRRIGQWCTVEELGPARCRVRMSADSLDWPAFALGVVAADFHVFEPAELRDQVREWGVRFSRAGVS